jgi:hypothetical protein
MTVALETDLDNYLLTHTTSLLYMISDCTIHIYIYIYIYI